MRLLHVANSLLTGGAERLLVESLPRFSSRQGIVQTDLALLNGIDTPFFQKLRANFEGRIFTLSSNSTYSPVAILRLRELIRNYDVVHVHLFPAMYYAALAKLTLIGGPKLIFTEHNTENRRVQSALFRIVDKLIYRQYEMVTAISEPVRSMLMSYKLHNDVRIIYNGIALNNAGINPPVDLRSLFGEAKCFTLIQVSRFQPQKDQQTVIRSLLYLPAEVKAVFVGAGELMGDCVRLVESLGLQNRVRFLGLRMDVPELLAGSDVVVQSSVYEGFGLAAVEGMAAAKPVVASDVPGLGDIVNGAGLTFKKGDAQELARLVLKLYLDKPFYDEVSARCLSRSKNFDIDVMVDKMVELYYEICQNT
ncbi:glycosyltransferase [Pedobacter yulinensis]|uniref:Glycosyltransferase n=1 Tax=Pedobacter yulinensis TaxID=2126353 RepID=A0A2T3HNS0_9SPHI|nr:glycosyltransferase [Pedobacter yulinensis]PST84057.1 glycosyltransferase [Pedobacter yulinensis]